MAENTAFFEVIERQYALKLPFVVYSRPINSKIKCWLQKDDELHTTTSYEDSGFVFAAFDHNKDAVLFPQDICDFATIDMSNFAVSATESHVDQPHNSDETPDSSRKAEHLNLVKKGLLAIEEGQFKKVVLSRVEIASIHEFDPVMAFMRLFNTYKNAMVYCWYHPKVGLWLGATPELLFKKEGQQLTAISLAGTQPVSGNKAPKWTSKELMEQQIVTDFLSAQLSPFAQKTEITEVESVRAGTLWHLKTRLKSHLKANSDLKSIIAALHPTPAVCGLPKQQAKVFIETNEGYDREFYTGFLGELNLKKRIPRNTSKRNVENSAYEGVKNCSNFYVNLRCMQFKNGEAHIYVGGGITKDSIPENEWIETQNKAHTISRILR